VTVKRKVLESGREKERPGNKVGGIDAGGASPSNASEVNEAKKRKGHKVGTATRVNIKRNYA